MMAVTLYALFGDDIKLAFCPKSSDSVFNVITLCAMALFTIEVILCSVTNPGYFNSFYFYLDIISTLTLLMDITWISESVIDQEDDYTGNSSEQGSQFATASRGARLGSRAGRIARVVRLVRLVRIAPLWKQATSRLQRRKSKNEEFFQMIQQQRTLNLMKERKMVESSRRDMTKMQRRATII